MLLVFENFLLQFAALLDFLIANTPKFQLDKVVVSVGMWGVMRQQPNGLGRVPRRNVINNRGAGRRGGNQFGPFLPNDPRHVANALNIANGIVHANLIPPPVFVNEDERGRVARWWNEERHMLEDKFVSSDFPKNRCLFTLEEVNKSTYGIHSVLFDPCGSPFCGLTAIDLASGIVS